LLLSLQNELINGELFRGKHPVDRDRSCDISGVLFPLGPDIHQKELTWSCLPLARFIVENRSVGSRCDDGWKAPIAGVVPFENVFNNGFYFVLPDPRANF